MLTAQLPQSWLGLLHCPRLLSQVTRLRGIFHVFQPLHPCRNHEISLTTFSWLSGSSPIRLVPVSCITTSTVTSGVDFEYQAPQSALLKTNICQGALVPGYTDSSIKGWFDFRSYFLLFD
jgi:hypothetical protein